MYVADLLQHLVIVISADKNIFTVGQQNKDWCISSGCSKQSYIFGNLLHNANLNQCGFESCLQGLCVIPPMKYFSIILEPKTHWKPDQTLMFYFCFGGLTMTSHFSKTTSFRKKTTKGNIQRLSAFNNISVSVSSKDWFLHYKMRVFDDWFASIVVAVNKRTVFNKRPPHTDTHSCHRNRFHSAVILGCSLTIRMHI